jgi:hypothetical protein
MRGFTVASLVVLVVVVAVVGTAAVLLARTVQEAQAINDKAQNIATTGRGINTATDSVIQLTRTNELARSILKSARPLDTQLGGIVSTAQGIDGLAGSINSTAGSINGRAGSINTTAGSINGSAGRINTSAGSINSSASSINSTAGSINSSASAINSSAGSINGSAGAINRSAGSINGSVGSINTSASRIDSSAGSILGVARQIDTDVRLINTNLDVTLSLVTAVKGDTGNILGQAGGANDTAACIDRKLMGQSGDDGDCQGQATPAAARQSGARTVLPQQLRSPDELREGLNLPPSSPVPTPGAAPAPDAPQPQPQPQGPLPGGLPDVPRTLDESLRGLLPDLGQNPDLPDLDRDRPLPGGGGSPNDLLDQLVPGLGQ